MKCRLKSVNSLTELTSESDGVETVNRGCVVALSTGCPKDTVVPACVAHQFQAKTATEWAVISAGNAVFFECSAADAEFRVKT